MSAGETHTLALLPDGTTVAWGFNRDFQALVPPLPVGLIYVEVAPERRLDVGWGSNYYAQLDVPPVPPGYRCVQIAHHTKMMAARFEPFVPIDTSFCSGDGSLPTPCPCVPPNTVPNPSGFAGHGCANAFLLDGALLQASGTLAPDTLQLECQVSPNFLGFAFLFKGNAMDANGVASSDGLRCADGQIIRFGGHFAGANGEEMGIWKYPNDVQTLPVTTVTAQPAGQSAYYQLFYRNASANFCNASTANLSNGIQLAWP